MSGGSLNYLFIREPEELLNIQRREEIEEVIRTLRELGLEEAARDNQELLDRIVKFHDELRSSIDSLQDVWKAVEWFRSNDWGKEDVIEAADNLAKRKAGPPSTTVEIPK